MQIGNKKEADENLDNNNDVHKYPLLLYGTYQLQISTHWLYAFVLLF